MAARRYADYEPQTNISDEDCVALQQRGAIKLTRKQCSSIETVLREYEHLSSLRRRGEGKTLKKALRELEAGASTPFKGVEAVQNEPGHIWEYLLDRSNAEFSCLGAFLEECKKLNQSVTRRGHPKDHFLDSLLWRLADIFEEATGRKATVSTGASETGASERGGRFLKFASAAVEFLPKRIPTSQQRRLRTSVQEDAKVRQGPCVQLGWRSASRIGKARV